MGCGFTFGLTPAFADSTEPSISSVEKQMFFTGYVVSIGDTYLAVAGTLTKEEALCYQENWWDLVHQNKIIIVPISNDITYTIGDKLNLYFNAMTSSLPPLAITSIIEKVIG